MNEFELNLRLKQELESLAPNRLEELLAACENGADRQSNIVPMPSRKRKRLPGLIAAAAAVLLLSSGTFFGVKSAQRSVVTLDVNPGVSISVNGFNRVKQVSLNNSDAAAILNAEELCGMRLDEAVESVAQELMDSNYLSPSANSVLVSVKDAGDRRAEKLGQIVSKAISEMTETAAFQPAVLVQQIDDEQSGRAVLAQAVGTRTAGFNPDAASALSVHELLYIVDSQNLVLKDTVLMGDLMNWRCRSGDDAQVFAAEFAGVDPASVSFITLLSIYEDQLAYQVSFARSGQWLKYWVSAETGEILNPNPGWTPEDHEILAAPPAAPPQQDAPPTVPESESEKEPIEGPRNIHDFFNFLDDLF